MPRLAKVARIDGFVATPETPESGVYAVVRKADEESLSTYATHDAKNMLSVLMSNVEWLRDAVRSGAEQKDLIEALDDLQSCTQRLTEIMREALETKTQDVGMNPRRSPVNVSTVLQTVYQQIRRQAATSDVRVEVRIQTDAVAMLDQSLIERVLINLIDNALRFAPPGSAIRIGCNAVDDWVELTVSDDGPGVDKAHSERIFEPYVTSSTSAFTDEPPHAGLGLAFCRAVARAHGGDVRAEQVPPSEGRGGRFIVTLPLVP